MSASMSPVRTPGDLCEHFGAPDEIVVKHKLPHIDKHAARFLAQCPFVIVATSDAEGRCDASPKGDPPGFVHIADEQTLYLPDRSGNKMFQSITNIMSNPHIGLLFIIPGEEWTMRINGRARVVNEHEVLDKLSARGRPAQLAIEVKVEECYFHCPRSFKRAELWNPERFRRYEGDSWGKILADRVKLDESSANLLDKGLEEGLKRSL